MTTRLLILLCLLLSSTAHAQTPTITIEPNGDGVIVRWSGAPPDATAMYGKGPIGYGASGAVALRFGPLPPDAYPGRAAVLLGPGNVELARVVTMGAIGVWQPTGLRVVWSEGESVCLYLSGGGLPTQRIADVPCDLTGDVVLSRGGVDYLLTPVGRDAVELRAQSDLTRLVRRIEIPGVGHRVRLPIVAQPAAPTWRVVLPVVVTS